MLCVIKLNRFTKAFPLVDLIPFFRGEDHPGATISHFSWRVQHFWLLAGFTSEPVRSVGMRGQGDTASDNTIRGATDGP